MADISKIRIEEGLYDIKDATARTNIDTINNTTIPDLQNDLQGKIDTINETTIPDLENTLQGEIDTINETTIPTLENTIDGKIDVLAHNDQTIDNLVVIADSYGVMDGVTNFPNYMKQFLNLDNDHFINNSYGGTGFAHAHDSKTFTTLISELSNLSEDRRNAVTHILFAGGYNDQWSTGEDIRAGVNSAITVANTLFPYAKIYVAHIGWSTNNSDLQHTFKSYYDGTCLTKYGKFINNSQNILRGDIMSLDQIHPTAEGLQLLAMNLITGLQTGSCYPSSEFKYLKDSNDNTLGVVIQDNDKLILSLDDKEFGYNGTASGSDITYLTLANNSMITGHNGCKFNVQCMFVNSGNGTYVMGECVFKISERVVTITPIALTPDAHGFMTFTSIRFNNYEVVIPHLQS